MIAEGDEGFGRIFSLLTQGSKTRREYTRCLHHRQWTRGRPAEQIKRLHHEGEEGYGGYYSVGETAGLKGRKRSLFSGGIRVPFIVRWPGVVPAGQTNNTSVVTAVDLLPTFLEVAGAALPEGYAPDGESMLAAFKGEDFTRTKPIFWEWKGGDNQDFTWPSLGIRDGKWKLLVNASTGESELYDLGGRLGRDQRRFV